VLQTIDIITPNKQNEPLESLQANHKQESKSHKQLLIGNGNQSIRISLVNKRAQQRRLNLHQQHQLTICCKLLVNLKAIINTE